MNINKTEPYSKAVVDSFLCAALRGDELSWPAEAEQKFYTSLLEQASRHGIEALLCHTLKVSAGWQHVPGFLRDSLLTSLKVAVAFEMLRSRDLTDLCNLARQAGIPILVMKGAAIAYTHYPEPYLRSRCDTDVLIRPDDIYKVREVLSRAGYELSGQIYKSHQFNGYRTMFGNAVNYDVHWRSTNGPSSMRLFSQEEAQRESIPIPGLDGVFTLKPIATLLLACVHRAGNPDHDPDRLIWLYDIYLLVSAMSDSELLEFAQRAVNADVQVECRDGIAKVSGCFPISIPEDVQNILSTPSVEYSIGKRFVDSALGLIVDDLRVLPDMHSRFALIREYLFPTGEYLLNRYKKQGTYWIPLLYFRYVLTGFIERVSLR